MLDSLLLLYANAMSNVTQNHTIFIHYSQKDTISHVFLFFYLVFLLLTVACIPPIFPYQVSDSFAHHRLPTTYALPQYPCRQRACGRQTTEYAQGQDFWNKC
jgi:hypothetical protein